MKKIKIKKILKYSVIPALLFLLAITIAPTLFYNQEKNDNPLPPYYQKGIYHMHSTFSDGAGNIDEITKAAATLGLDFVILTDHGRPNIQCAKATGYYNNVLLIGGSEFSMNCGHLTALGFQIPDYIFPPEPQEAIDEVTADKGVCFIAHPFDRIAWTDWEIENFTGIELLSLSSYAGKMSIGQFLKFLVQYPFNSKYALLNTIAYPRQNIDKWNAVNAGGKYYGIYALDAHARLEVTEKIWFNFPTYRALGQILTVYVKSGQRPRADAGKNPHDASGEIISALRKGNFFNVVEAIAPANGFEARFIDENGESIEMGGSTGLSRGRIEIELPFSFETEIVVKRDGKIFKSSKIFGGVGTFFQKGSDPPEANSHRPTAKIEIDEPGVYFLEVYAVKNRFSKLPWILTNPFFIGVDERLTRKRVKLYHFLPPAAPAGEAKLLKKFEQNFLLFRIKNAPCGEAVCRPPTRVGFRIKNAPVSSVANFTADKKDYFSVASNSLSKGSISHEMLKPAAAAAEGTGDELLIKLDFELHKEPGKEDFWVSLARRQDFDFSGFSGIVFEARAGKKMRFWFELRTKENNNERWYSHSFLPHREWQQFYIPFDRFHLVYGKRECRTYLKYMLYTLL